MLEKETFELISDQFGKVYNILPVNKLSLKAYDVSNEDIMHLKMLVNAYGRVKGGAFSNIVNDKNMDLCSVVRMPSYPLPGTITKDKYPVINLSVLPSPYITDMATSDIYALYLYSISLHAYMSRNLFESSIESHISQFLILFMMKLFSKKYGLLGSYKSNIPRLQALTALYVHCGFMNFPMNSNEINKISNNYMTDLNELNLDEDISTIIGYLKLLKINGILPLTENVFSTNVINVAGLSCIPLFESKNRFFSTILGASISGNSIFSGFIKKVNPSIFDKLVYIAISNLKRVM